MNAAQSSARPLRWAGTRAFLVECESLTDVMQLHAHVSSHPYPGQIEALAAGATVLLEFESTRLAQAAAHEVATLAVQAQENSGTKTVEIDVVYDGADLAEVGELTGLGVQGVIGAHTGATWSAAFGGFAPGFTYLVAEGDPLTVPRRSTPRTEVPAGSVALAGAFSAVYPQKSPGGWQLIGHTNAVLWDLSRESPALIRPGDTVRYRAVRESVSVTASTPETISSGEASAVTYGLTIVDPGMQSLLEDLGRPGLGDLGVVASGAADRASARQANRLVGNDAGAVVIESLMDGLKVTARGHQALALTGANGGAKITGPNGTRQVRRYSAFPLYDGETLTLGVATHGLRTYLAARGGFRVTEVLGSGSRDVISGIGPAPLTAGDTLAVETGSRAVGQAEGPAVDAPSTGQLMAVGPNSRGEGPAVSLPEDDTATLRCVAGPRDDWFTPAAFKTLTTTGWKVSSQSNRVGVRFEPPQDGSVLERAKHGELASEGVAVGSLQVPHSGVPVLFLADHPVTGGYPVIAVVIPEDLPLAAQLPPGATVRFQLVDHPSTQTSGEQA